MRAEIHRFLSFRGACGPALAVMVWLALAVSSCHSSRKVFYVDDIYGPADTRAGRSHGYSADASKDARRVLNEAEKWLGTPYKYGGSSREGTDCSGLTTMAFLNGAGVRLPRTSSEQAEQGRRVKRSDARPGDLVFFTAKSGGKGRINHVAIYAGDGRIIHSTTSRGVCYSNLGDPYWESHFKEIRRILGD